MKIAQAETIKPDTWQWSALTMVGVISLGLMLTGCNTPTKAVENAAQEEAGQTGTGTEEAAENSQSNIIRRQSTVTQKGTSIRAIVNGEPITNYDVRRRAAFLKLRRVGGNRSAKAIDEMVEQTIKRQEARKRGALAGDNEVNAAFANFAKSNRMNSAQLTRVLSQSGVTAGHFKEFIRGQISWRRAVGNKVRSQTRKKTTQEAMFELRKSGAEKPQSTEYLMEQIIFVVPRNRANNKGYIAQRRKEAANFRPLYSGCGSAFSLVAGLRDVSIRKLPRSLELQLPPDWKDELTALSQGQISQPKTTEKGVEMIGICSKKVVSDDNVAVMTDQSKQFEDFNKRGDEIARSFYEELKAKSQIVYR